MDISDPNFDPKTEFFKFYFWLNDNKYKNRKVKNFDRGHISDYFGYYYESLITIWKLAGFIESKNSGAYRILVYPRPIDKILIGGHSSK
jgi:hypothetical protein